MTGLPGSLGVVRVQIAPETYVTSLPMPRAEAQDQAVDFITAVARTGDAADLIAFDNSTGLDCWIRAREVLTVDIVATEDPSL